MWAMAAAPIDSSGRDRGEARAPAALRAAGLAKLPGIEDRGDLEARIADPVRDPATGVIGFADLVDSTEAIAAWVAETAVGPHRPLLVGGDCSLLPGVFAGLRRAGIEAGLWMVDGHPDAYDGTSSPSGEAADMELTFLLGDAPRALAEIWGGDERPLLDSRRVAVLGHRPAASDPEVARELGGVPSEVLLVDAPAIVERGAAAVAAQATALLAGLPAWLHLDLDTLDAEVFPAVSYPQPHGLDWDSLAELAEPLATAPGLIGISVADLEPERDPDGTHSRRVVAFLGELLARTAD
ncbi:MAG: arginase family protein [Solirubrobacterales bacterium]